MTMPSSGALNMALTTSPVSVASELGLGLMTTISMNDAAVRTLAGVGGSGTSWSMNSLYGKSSIIIDNALVCDAVSTISQVDITFTTSGPIVYTEAAYSSGSTDWATPTTAGIGNSYWIKLTKTSGNTILGMTSGTIYALSTNRTVYITTSGGFSSGTIDIYSDSGGTTRVGGGTFSLQL